jgi:hypothetical protein
VQHHPSCTIDAMERKHPLCQIDPYSSNLVHGFPLLQIESQGSILAVRCRCEYEAPFARSL